MPMKDYRVTWEMDISASSPLTAAIEAFKRVLDPDGTATVFQVAESGEVLGAFDMLDGQRYESNIDPIPFRGPAPYRLQKPKNPEFPTHDPETLQTYVYEAATWESRNSYCAMCADKAVKGGDDYQDYEKRLKTDNSPEQCFGCGLWLFRYGVKRDKGQHPA